MQTYTHLASAAAFAVLVAPHEPVMQAAFVIGAIAPDLTLVPEFVADRLAGRGALVRKSRVTELASEIGHSVPLWAVLTIVAFTLGWPVVVAAFLLGGISHQVIDLFTHGDPNINRVDATYIWPFPWRGLRGTRGIWDYRWGVKAKLWPPKPFEAAVLIVSLAILAAHWL